MATWTKDPITGERTLTTPATAPKARCCVEVAEVKTAKKKSFFSRATVTPEPITETVTATDETTYQSTD